MRRSRWIAAVTVPALCLGWSVIAPSNRALAGSQVPFKGSDVGHFELPGLCEDGSLQVVIGGTGTATHLGSYNFNANECFDPATGSFKGTPTFIAANGDRLFGTYTGQVAATLDINVVTYREQLLIKGGTGRFAGASGIFEVKGEANLATGAYSQTLSGNLSSQGSAGG